MNIKRGGSREPKKPPLDPPLSCIQVTSGGGYSHGPGLVSYKSVMK